MRTIEAHLTIEAEDNFTVEDLRAELVDVFDFIEGAELDTLDINED